MPFRLQEMSIGRSPVASQISEALSPFLTDNLTNFSLKCGGAGKDEAVYAFGMGVSEGVLVTSGAIHALRKCKWARSLDEATRLQKDYSSASLWRLFLWVMM